MKKKNRKKEQKLWLVIIAIIVIIIIGISNDNIRNYIEQVIEGQDVLAVATNAIGDIGKQKAESTKVSFSLDTIPEFKDEPYVIINNNKPNFEEKDFITKSFEEYSELDVLGRCGVAFANIGKDIMPTEPRGEIGMIKPTGWQYSKYDFVDGKYLYNRCHLIGFQLAGENANKKNLITGTRYLNVDGMLPFENQIAEYVKKKNKHVLYRVTPCFVGDELVCRGVHIEALSIEDLGIGISTNVFVYNVQECIEIDYSNGESKLVK